MARQMNRLQCWSSSWARPLSSRSTRRYISSKIFQDRQNYHNENEITFTDGLKYQDFQNTRPKPRSQNLALQRYPIWIPSHIDIKFHIHARWSHTRVIMHQAHRSHDTFHISKNLQSSILRHNTSDTLSPRIKDFVVKVNHSFVTSIIYLFIVKVVKRGPIPFPKWIPTGSFRKCRIN